MNVLARLPADIRASLSPAQCDAIRLHLGARYEVAHRIDWRRGFRLFGRQFYFVFLAGSVNRGGRD